MCEGDNLLLEDLPEYLTGGAEGPSLYALPAPSLGEDKTMLTPDTLLTLSQLEKDYIQRALEICQRNHTEAARRLGISSSTLWRKLKEHGMEAAAAH